MRKRLFLTVAEYHTGPARPTHARTGPPSVSEAVTVQMMVSPLSAVVDDRSTVLLLPRLPELLPVQA